MTTIIAALEKKKKISSATMRKSRFICFCGLLGTSSTEKKFPRPWIRFVSPIFSYLNSRNSRKENSNFGDDDKKWKFVCTCFVIIIIATTTHTSPFASVIGPVIWPRDQFYKELGESFREEWTSIIIISDLFSALLLFIISMAIFFYFARKWLRDKCWPTMALSSVYTVSPVYRKKRRKN